MGGKLHKVDRIRIRQRARLSKSISMQDLLLCKTEKNSLFSKSSLNSRTTFFTRSGEGKASLFSSKVESVS